MTLAEDTPEHQLAVLEHAMARLPGAAGARPPRCVGCAEMGALDAASEEGPLLLRGYGVAVVPRRVVTEGMAAVLAAEEGVEEARPEFFLYALAAPAPAPGLVDDARRTWGVAAVGADASPLTGAGVRLAVLDTGLDAGHPDFAGRAVVAQGFVAGAGTGDAQGHGTHCAGTAAGPGARGNRPRYGVAPEALLHVGKVLGDDGVGGEGDIVAGMAWAVEQGCEVISMSRGRATQPGESPNLV